MRVEVVLGLIKKMHRGAFQLRERDISKAQTEKGGWSVGEIGKAACS